jgi:hypothetical protein
LAQVAAVAVIGRDGRELPHADIRHELSSARP